MPWLQSNAVVRTAWVWVFGSLEDRGFEAAPSESQMKQIAMVRSALSEAAQSVDRLRDQVSKFNDAMNAAKVPFLSVP